ncbi:AIPR protein [uncultured archaeon]|nr:AIPR protein [uncultured archaeon]
MANKYELLLNVLDSIISEAPTGLKKYDTSTEEKTKQARARALIHLFLRTKFGLINFSEAEKFITDDDYDGGLDAFYIDQENKKIYLIQSKFRTTEENFEEIPINGYELFKMDLGKILKSGSECDIQGNKYNGKILGFQRAVKEISNIGKYQYHLVFLGNIPSNLDPNKINEVSGNVCDSVEIITGKETYNGLVLPYLQSDFYNKRDFILKIRINQNQSNRINYSVKIGDQVININLSFIPTIELAKMMFEYKNSLLRYNPRCYVGIKKGGVNKQIEESISNTHSNEFSLLNNGITILCNDFEYNERNAEQGTATLIITNPQIVNGGQTAFTLSRMYSGGNNELFSNKEVLVKFISLNHHQTQEQIKLIEKISEATNNQTPVYLSDRKSNDDTLILLQRYLFENHSLLLERKTGEFFEMLNKKVISPEKIIDKEQVMRLCFVISGKISEARSYSGDKLFQQYPITSTNFEDIYNAIRFYRLVESFLEKTNNSEKKFNVKKFGYGLKYGKLAITYALFSLFKKFPDREEKVVEFVKNKWLDFETTVSNSPDNQGYFGDSFDYANYYKGKNLNKDLKLYFNESVID